MKMSFSSLLGKAVGETAKQQAGGQVAGTLLRGLKGWNQQQYKVDTITTTLNVVVGASKVDY